MKIDRVSYASTKERLKGKIWIPQIVLSAMLFLAIPSNNNEYYMILRWVCCGVFAFLAKKAHDQRKDGLVWVLGIMAMFYNPVFPVHLNDIFWQAANVFTIGVSIWSIFSLAREEGSRDQEPSIENEVTHSGCLGFQYTFHVGKTGGIGGLYLQIFIDAYSNVAFAKLYKNRTPISAVDLLSDRVLPFYAEQRQSLIRILTDRRREYCGNAEKHDYELFLTINEIVHLCVNKRLLQTNEVCKNFNETLHKEFFPGMLTKAFHRNIETLQADLDEWMERYNFKRIHQ